jgi:NAD(P)-dependent dehydrogenase (short-subunit alcohol dehydrogenase family)
VRPIDEPVVLVTGSTDGLGRAVARELAAQGATVLLHGRDAVRGEATMLEIRGATGNERVELHLADFSSLAQVRSLAGQILARHERLDALVNNAGIAATGVRQVSEDGYELHLAVNYLAAYLLTRLLEPLLVRSAPSRVVNVASAGQAELDFDDLMLERGYSGSRAYAQSKLALVMFTFDLAGELEDRRVTVNSLHPGTYMPTKMVLEAGVTPVDSLESGVQATMQLVTDPELDGVTGMYFDRMREARAHPAAYDETGRGLLRARSAELTGGTL